MVHAMQGKQEALDSSPPRRRPAAGGTPDASPPRRSQAAAGPTSAGQKAAVMQSGANAGLVRGQELKEQLLRKQQVILIILAPWHLHGSPSINCCLNEAAGVAAHIPVIAGAPNCPATLQASHVYRLRRRKRHLPKHLRNNDAQKAVVVEFLNLY